MRVVSLASIVLILGMVAPNMGMAQTADEIKLTNMVAAALAAKDYQRAEWLAVTAKHHEMIAEARRREEMAQLAAKQARKRTRPVITHCNQWAPNYTTCITP